MHGTAAEGSHGLTDRGGTERAFASMTLSPNVLARSAVWPGFNLARVPQLAGHWLVQSCLCSVGPAARPLASRPAGYVRIASSELFSAPID